MCHAEEVATNAKWQIDDNIFYFNLYIDRLWLFFPSFPSIFGSSYPHYSTSYHYNFSDSSSPFLSLHLSIFFSISLYRYFSSNSSPLFLALLLPIIPHITVTTPLTIHLLIFLFLFSINLLLLPLHFYLFH